jgi:adenylate kinase family enzyme
MTELAFDEIVKLVSNKKIKAINVCGSPGSGKSTLSKKLSEILGYKLVDLDDILYTENCKRKSTDEDILSLKQVLSEQDILVDGTYSSTLKFRSDKIDLFIFTERNILLSLYRFMKRLMTAKEIKCGERFTWKTFYLILNYKKVECEIFTKIIPTEKLIIYNNK